MAQGFTRKDFFTLTITVTALGVAAACGDENDTWSDVGAGKSGRGGDQGDGTVGPGGADAGGTNANKPDGAPASGTSAGGNGGTSGSRSGGKAGSGQAGERSDAGNGSGGDGNDAGGVGNFGGTAGENGAAGQGGQANAGQSGGGGEGGVGGRATCGGATLTQTAGPGHDHIPANPAAMFANFTALVDGSNPTATFVLPIDNAHSHNIVLSAGEVAKLRAGGQVRGLLSTLTNGHLHTYTISCG